MKAILLSLFLVTSAFANPKGSQYKGKEKIQNLVCLRVERIYEDHKKRVKCAEKNGEYTLKIWSNLETIEVDFIMAEAVLYNSAVVVPMLKPKKIKIVNNYGEQRGYSFSDLERKFK